MRLTTQEVGAKPGAGTPTVLVHGFLGSGRNLQTLARRWLDVDSARAILLPDLTGHGTSPPLPPGAGLDTLAADVLETAAAAGVGDAPLHWVGHSLGGLVGLAALGRAPERVASLVLLDISPSSLAKESRYTGAVLEALLAMPASAKDRREMRQKLIEQGQSPSMADWLAMNLSVEGGEARWRIDRQALHALHERVKGVDLWPLVEKARVPLRCIRGANSSYVSDEDARRLVAAGCPVETLEGSGHFVHVEALDKLVESLARR